MLPMQFSPREHGIPSLSGPERSAMNFAAAVIKKHDPEIQRKMQGNVRTFAGRPPETMEGLGTLVRYHRGHKIYGPADPVDYWYRLLSGAARKCTLMADGRRQILEFLLPGDLFGFAAWDEHRFGVEVIAEGT